MQAAEIHSGLEGAEFAEIPKDQGVEGVLVQNVDPDSPAAQRGLEPGDIILRVNRKPVTSVQELTEAAAGAKSLLLRVRRGKVGETIQLFNGNGLRADAEIRGDAVLDRGKHESGNAERKTGAQS